MHVWLGLAAVAAIDVALPHDALRSEGVEKKKYKSSLKMDESDRDVPGDAASMYDHTPDDSAYDVYPYYGYGAYYYEYSNTDIKDMPRKNSLELAESKGLEGANETNVRFAAEDGDELCHSVDQSDPLRLSGQRILFLGPANTAEAMRADKGAYDVVVITNNMIATDFNRTSWKRVVLFMNIYFGGTHQQETKDFAPDGILSKCKGTRQTSAEFLGDLGGIGIPFDLVPKPKFWPERPRGIPLGLSFFLEYATHFAFKSLHITGITFYEGGSASYVPGYELLPMAGRHKVRSNKVFLAKLMQKYPGITCDYNVTGLEHEPL